jgi:hypothetical protein
MEKASETEHLVTEAESLAKEIDDALIVYASPDARQEWAALRARWPKVVSEHHTPAIAAEDEDLSVIVGKVRRFRAILGRSASQSAAPVRS